jgi:hypothetical protein
MALDTARDSWLFIRLQSSMPGWGRLSRPGAVVIRAFYRRLIAAGMPKKVALNRVHAAAPQDSQRHDADQHDLAAAESNSIHLTFKTVAIVSW